MILVIWLGVPVCHNFSFFAFPVFLSLSWKTSQKQSRLVKMPWTSSVYKCVQWTTSFYFDPVWEVSMLIEKWLHSCASSNLLCNHSIFMVTSIHETSSLCRKTNTKNDTYNIIVHHTRMKLCTSIYHLHCVLMDAAGSSNTFFLQMSTIIYTYLLHNVLCNHALLH